MFLNSISCNLHYLLRLWRKCIVAVICIFPILFLLWAQVAWFVMVPSSFFQLAFWWSFRIIRFIWKNHNKMTFTSLAHYHHSTLFLKKRLFKSRVLWLQATFYIYNALNIAKSSLVFKRLFQRFQYLFVYKLRQWI